MNELPQKPQSNIGAVMHRAGEDIGIKDKNGNDIFVGAVIKHNNNLYLIKWSDKQKQFVARAEPIKGQTKSWRDTNWIKNLSNKYIEMVGTILFDEEIRKRFDGVYRAGGMRSLPCTELAET